MKEFLVLTEDEKRKIRQMAYRQLGKRYIYGYEVYLEDQDPKAFDCSELVQWLFYQLGYIVPDGSQAQYDCSYPVGSDIATGDLVFLRRDRKAISHVGIVVEKDIYRGWKIVEAVGGRTGKVRVSFLEDWKKNGRFAGIRRFLKIFVSKKSGV
jgi:hypothetical protein